MSKRVLFSPSFYKLSTRLKLLTTIFLVGFANDIVSSNDCHQMSAYGRFSHPNPEYDATFLRAMSGQIPSLCFFRGTDPSCKADEYICPGSECECEVKPYVAIKMSHEPIEFRFRDHKNFSYTYTHLASPTMIVDGHPVVFFVVEDKSFLPADRAICAVFLEKIIQKFNKRYHRNKPLRMDITCHHVSSLDSDSPLVKYAIYESPKTNQLLHYVITSKDIVVKDLGVFEQSLVKLESNPSDEDLVISGATILDRELSYKTYYGAYTLPLIDCQKVRSLELCSNLSEFCAWNNETCILRNVINEGQESGEVNNQTAPVVGEKEGSRREDQATGNTKKGEDHPTPDPVNSHIDQITTLIYVSVGSIAIIIILVFVCVTSIICLFKKRFGCYQPPQVIYTPILPGNSVVTTLDRPISDHVGRFTMAIDAKNSQVALVDANDGTNTTFWREDDIRSARNSNINLNSRHNLSSFAADSDGRDAIDQTSNPVQYRPQIAQLQLSRPTNINITGLSPRGEYPEDDREDSIHEPEKHIEKTPTPSSLKSIMTMHL